MGTAEMQNLTGELAWQSGAEWREHVATHVNIDADEQTAKQTWPVDEIQLRHPGLVSVWT